MWSRCKNDVVEDVIVFEDAFNILGSNTYIGFVYVVWNSYDFKVGLGLGKSRESNTVVINLE